MQTKEYICFSLFVLATYIVTGSSLGWSHL